MAHIVRDWRNALVEAHPGPVSRRGRASPGRYKAYPECGEGWRDLLDRACIRVRGGDLGRRRCVHG